MRTSVVRLLTLLALFVAFTRPAAASETFSAWVARHNVPETQTGPGDDPAGDGVANLIKYALGLNPMVPSREGLPAAEVIPVEGTDRLGLSIQKNPDAVGIEFVIEASSDLAAWSSEGLIVVEDTPETLTVADQFPVSDSPRRFFRLQIPAPEEGPLPQAYLFVVGGRGLSSTDENIDAELDAPINENLRSILVADVDIDNKSVANWRRAGLLPLQHPELTDDQGEPRTVQWNYVHDHVNVHNGRIYIGPGNFSGGGSVVSDFVAWADIDYATGAIGEFQTSPFVLDNQRIGATTIAEIDGVYYYYVLGGSVSPSGQTDRILYAQIDSETGAVGEWNVSGTTLPATDWFNAAIADSGKIIHASGNLRDWNAIDWAAPASGGNILSSWNSQAYTWDFSKRWDHVMLTAEAGGNRFAYLLGGALEGGEVLNRVDLIPLDAGVPGSASTANPLPQERRRFAGASHADMIVIPGGSMTSAISGGQTTVYIGAVAPDGQVTWTEAEEPMLQPRSFHGAAMVPVPQN